MNYQEQFLHSSQVCRALVSCTSIVCQPHLLEDKIMASEDTQLPCQDYLQYCIEPDASCKDFIMQQTMMRIKDPRRSLKFYTEILGMRYVGMRSRGIVLGLRYSPGTDV